jgi:hypothetical protein
MNTTPRILLLGSLLWLGLAAAQAQSGPQIPCAGCDQRQQRALPTEGMWYNPEQSGTGFMIDVRNQHLGGTWYGYDETGKPTWLIFSAPLVPGETPEVMWTVDADLVHFEGGNCANCPYQPPAANEVVGRIHLEFYQMSHASVKINDGEKQFVVPVTFGGLPRVQLGDTPYYLPDTYGQWLFVFKKKDDAFGLPDANWNYQSIVVDVSHLRKSNVPPDRPYTAYLDLVPNPAEILVIGNFECYEPTETRAAYCELQFPSFNPTPENYYITYRIPLANMEEDKIFGETPEGDYFIAYKINDTTTFDTPPEQ